MYVPKTQVRSKCISNVMRNAKTQMAVELNTSPNTKTKTFWFNVYLYNNVGNTQGMFTYRNIYHGTPPAKKYTQIINKLAAAVRPLKKHNGDAWEKQPSDDDFFFIFRRRQRSSVVCLKVKSDALRTSLVIAGP